MGLPHSDIPGSQPAGDSPGLFAAIHVLHRLSVPRHPPCALPSSASRSLDSTKPAGSTSSCYFFLLYFACLVPPTPGQPRGRQASGGQCLLNYSSLLKVQPCHRPSPSRDPVVDRPPARGRRSTTSSPALGDTKIGPTSVEPRGTREVVNNAAYAIGFPNVRMARAPPLPISVCANSAARRNRPSRPVDLYYTAPSPGRASRSADGWSRGDSNP